MHLHLLQFQLYAIRAWCQHFFDYFLIIFRSQNLVSWSKIRRMGWHTAIRNGKQYGLFTSAGFLFFVDPAPKAHPDARALPPFGLPRAVASGEDAPPAPQPFRAEEVRRRRVILGRSFSLLQNLRCFLENFFLDESPGSFTQVIPLKGLYFTASSRWVASIMIFSLCS